MANPPIHAPDGGEISHALCESKRGDVTDYERDVSCAECLDDLEIMDAGMRRQLASFGFKFAPVTHAHALSRIREIARKQGLTLTVLQEDTAARFWVGHPEATVEVIATDLPRVTE